MEPIVFFGIGGLAILMAVAVAGAVWVSDRQHFPRVLAIMIAVMAIQFFAAQSGVLKQSRRNPPLMAPLIGVTLVLTVALAYSRTGDAMIRRFPVSVLIGFQVFRLPLELLMHRAAVHGIMPVQMSYSGDNFDIVSGILALPVALIALIAGHARLGRVSVFVWNVVGSVLLVTVILIAVASAPQIAAFGRDNLNTWVADAPYIWLPGVLVPCALLGHLLVWRSLRAPVGSIWCALPGQLTEPGR